MLHPSPIKTYRDIFGYFTFERFYDYIANNFVKDGMNILELGAFLGKSTAFMADRVKRRGLLNVKFYTVDHWLGSKEHLDPKGQYYIPQLSNDPEYLWKTFENNMRACNLRSFVKPIRKSSVEAAKDFENGTFDFIFLDGGHEYEDVCSDIDAWLPKLKEKDAILAGDDYRPIWPGVQKAVNEKLPNRKLEFPPVWYIRR